MCMCIYVYVLYMYMYIFTYLYIYIYICIHSYVYSQWHDPVTQHTWTRRSSWRRRDTRAPVMAVIASFSRTRSAISLSLRTQVECIMSLLCACDLLCRWSAIIIPIVYYEVPSLYLSAIIIPIFQHTQWSAIWHSEVPSLYLQCIIQESRMMALHCVCWKMNPWCMVGMSH